MVGLAFVGFFAYLIINTIVGFIAVSAESSADNGAAYAVAAVVLVLIGIGAGIGLLLVRKPWAKGMGIGLMIGWALVSIVSAGWCTGLNPGMYT